MDGPALQTALQGLGLGEIRYFDRVDSTHTVAARWAAAGAPDLSLVFADEQTAGRGRGDRSWYTPPGVALAFSLILRPPPDHRLEHPTRMAGLGALAVCRGLQTAFGLQPRIKWPNDVLLNGCKVAGILPEADWLGGKLQAVLLGIGVNISPAAVPPPDYVDFPATSVESTLGAPADRMRLLRSILEAVLRLRPRLNSRWFLDAWEAMLAYKGASVRATAPNTQPIEGQLLGLDDQGGLILRLENGENHALRGGDIRLRPG